MRRICSFEIRALKVLGLTALGAAGLAACATPSPRLPINKTPPKVTADRDYHGPPPPGYGQGLRGTDKPYQIKGIWYYPKNDPDYDVVGVGSWYGEQFHNRRTANGEIFDMDLPSAAHKTLPLPSIVEVTNLDNGKKMRLRVNDRGPFVGDRVIDLSRAAAEELGYRRSGVAKVRVRYIGPAPKTAVDQPRRFADIPATPPPAKPAYREIPREMASNLYDQPDDAPPARIVQAASSASGAFRVQAGSFANRDNAERAAERLASAGRVTVEPMDRAGGTLYRVVVNCGADEGEAWGVRDRVASLGFGDATVLRP
ncbi:septal ring lytic transglycosylase RlpA family protein [Caulobacter hibisci]|uniref:Endolytic peptidoglycan transglycosylase RlpA n=1 Tax=Caulobacter hibisci TaxID=2035993 RepID=A0ABS0SU98_9CAUL|nr:septal ring lytic transglycosylase RlpA family protein [Caulobacter hibisci]MBI1683225.1 septal ring lytic transglycosylase RlpA family protein [Caulobacter hibisci]